MAKKEEFFGKLNMKNYNSQLEEVLEFKNFSVDVKNILLSMLYKIETSFKDYSIAKCIVGSKSDFIGKIVDIIKNDCREIKLVKPSDEEYESIKNETERCLIDKENQSITCIYNEQNLLYALFRLERNVYKFPNNIVGKALEEALSYGRAINAKEVIRDFDGWAWNMQVNLIEDINLNLLFQNIIILIGDGFRTENEMKQRLASVFGKNAENVYIFIARIAMLSYLRNHPKERKEILKYREDITNRAQEMDNKVDYLQDIMKQRRNIEKRIRTIDDCLNNPKRLKEEFLQLKEEDKIFSMSDLAESMQNEKLNLSIKLKQYNTKMMPQNYIKEKEEIAEMIEIFKAFDSKMSVSRYMLDFQKKFLKIIMQKTMSLKMRNDIINMFYFLRYYKFLPFKEGLIKDVTELKEDIYNIEEILFEAAYNMNALNLISINRDINNNVLREILDTKIIDLKSVEVLVTSENYQIVLKIYDEENLEKVLEYDTITGMVAKRDKRFRLFIR